MRNKMEHIITDQYTAGLGEISHKADKLSLKGRNTYFNIITEE
jgi:hypothetical protein